MFLTKLKTDSYEEFRQKFRLPEPENFNFAFDAFEAMAREKPEALCLRHVDNELNVRDYNFRQMDEAANRAASAFKNLGLKKGDRVILILHRRLEWWHCLLGLHKLGAVAIPAPAQLSVEDIVFRCNLSQARAMVVDSQVGPKVQDARRQCPQLEFCLEANGDAPVQAPAGWHNYHQLTAEASPQFPRPVGEAYAGGRDPLLIFFSSGTTGHPKMVEHTHEYPLGHIFTGLYWHDLNEGDLHLTVADTGWGKAVWGKSYGQWLAGAAVFVFDFRGKFDPPTLLKVLSEYGVTTFCAPPTVYRFLVREDLKAYDLSRLRHCTTAGELLNESVFHAWHEATGRPLYEGFGQTETALQIATLPNMTPKPGSIGRPVPGWDVALLNEDGEMVPRGQEGEICIRISEKRPFGLFTGYLDEEAQTAQALRDGWYHTGDKAWADEDGYYWFLGRVDDLIKSSGYRIGPFEVESSLVSHPAVIEAAVTGVPDPLRRQSINATVAQPPGYEPGDQLTRELQEHVKKVTAPYKYPRVVEYVAELPKTISGKIKRAEIRQRDLKSDLTVAQLSTENVSADLWAEASSF